MLKISEIEPALRARTLRLEGQLVGPWVEELRSACGPMMESGRPWRLHLAEVEYLDAAGVALLLELRTHGAALTESPPFVAEQLRLAGVSG